MRFQLLSHLLTRHKTWQLLVVHKSPRRSVNFIQAHLCVSQLMHFTFMFWGCPLSSLWPCPHTWSTLTALFHFSKKKWIMKKFCLFSDVPCLSFTSTVTSQPEGSVWITPQSMLCNIYHRINWIAVMSCFLSGAIYVPHSGFHCVLHEGILTKVLCLRHRNNV